MITINNTLASSEINIMLTNFMNIHKVLKF